jgi:hypothetical protein
VQWRLHQNCVACCVVTSPPPPLLCPAGSGYTGSYIFSQTIFSMRAGVSHWSHGALIAALEAAIFLLPFSGMVQASATGLMEP